MRDVSVVPGCEPWTMGRRGGDRIDAFEMVVGKKWRQYNGLVWLGSNTGEGKWKLQIIKKHVLVSVKRQESE